ncbi:choline/ethanolamine transporter flvcr2a-like [Styela clava]
MSLSLQSYYHNRETQKSYGLMASDSSANTKMYPRSKKDLNLPSEGYKSIYSQNSDGTSCYGTESSTSSVVWTDDNDILHIPAYIKYDMPSYKNPHPSWQQKDGNKRFADEQQKKNSNNNHRKSIGYDSENSSEINDYKDTILSEFLRDLDKIAECRMERDVNSEDGNSDAAHDEDKPKLPIKPCSQRWFVLALICISIGTRSFVSVVFGQINDVFSTYFDVGPDAVDWLTNTGSLTTLFAIITLIICGGRAIKLRMLCIFMTATACFSTALLTAAMTDRKYGYMLGIAGQVALGLNNAVAMSIAPMMAATWFPDGQVATAISAPLVSVGIGEALGSFIPGVIVFTSELFSANFESSGGSGAIETELELSEDTEAIMRYKLVLLFGIPAAISLIVLVVSFAVFKERPKFPPSEAQAVIREKSLLKRQMNAAERSALISVSRSSVQANSFMNSSGTMQLLRNNSFILVTFIYGVVAASASSSITLLSSMLSYVDEDGTNADALSGRIMAILWICFTVGPFVTGIALDATHKYREIAIITVIGLTIGSAGIPLSFYTGNFKGLYISHALVGFFMGAAETTMFEIAAETTYPAPELTFASILNTSWVIFFVVYPIAGRIILNKFEIGEVASAAASIIPAICTAIAALVTISFLKPTYRRQASNHSKSNRNSQSITNERTPLLQNT